jgi:hypothetical protein
MDLSEAAFVSLVNDPSHCVVCAKKMHQKTNEHVIPNWLVRKHKLFDEEVRLPQGKSHKMSTYKVPFCRECNEVLGRKLEEPVAAAFGDGFEAVEALAKAGDDRLFAWMNLMYFKTHYKDMQVRKNLDDRDGLESIGDSINWKQLKTHYSIFRSFIFDIELKKSVIGTMIALKIHDHEKFEPFHYSDVLDWDFSYFRDGETALLCGLKDIGSVDYFFRPNLERLGNTLSQHQAFELLAECETISRRLFGNWQFDHEFDPNGGTAILEVVVNGEVGLRKCDEQFLRDGLHFIFESFLSSTLDNDAEREAILRQIRSGKLSFLSLKYRQSMEQAVFPDDWQFQRWHGQYTKDQISVS